MIQWILVCFGCCCSPKKVENIEKAKTSQVSAQVVSSSNAIMLRANKEQPTVLIVREDKFNDLEATPVQDEDNCCDVPSSKQEDHEGSSGEFSILNLLKENSLSKVQLMKGVSNDHLHGTVIELNLEDGTYKGKHDSGEIVTGTIESLRCCFYTINHQDE